jgi:hypothetical protein
MWLIASIEWQEYQEDEKKFKELEKEMDEQFDALCTPDMGEEDLVAILLHSWC